MASEPKVVALKSVRRHERLIERRLAARAVSIGLAFQEGATITEIAEAAGLSRGEVVEILDAQR